VWETLLRDGRQIIRSMAPPHLPQTFIKLSSPITPSQLSRRTPHRRSLAALRRRIRAAPRC
jgi:hypothetical protein